MINYLISLLCHNTRRNFGNFRCCIFCAIRAIGAFSFLLIPFCNASLAGSDRPGINIVEKHGPDQVIVHIFDQDLYFHLDDIVGISFPGIGCGDRTRATTSLNYAFHDSTIASCIKSRIDQIGQNKISVNLYISFEFFKDKYNNTLHPEPFLGLFERATLPIFSPDTLTINIQPPHSRRLNSQCKHLPFGQSQRIRGELFPSVRFLSGRLYHIQSNSSILDDQNSQIFCSETSGASICSICLKSNDSRIEATLHWFQNTVSPTNWLGLASTLRQILNHILPLYKDKFQ